MKKVLTEAYGTPCVIHSQINDARKSFRREFLLHAGIQTKDQILDCERSTKNERVSGAAFINANNEKHE